jgi:hypothetical protein
MNLDNYSVNEGGVAISTVVITNYSNLKPKYFVLPVKGGAEEDFTE